MPGPNELPELPAPDGDKKPDKPVNSGDGDRRPLEGPTRPTQEERDVRDVSKQQKDRAAERALPDMNQVLKDLKNRIFLKFDGQMVELNEEITIGAAGDISLKHNAGRPNDLKDRHICMRMAENGKPEVKVLAEGTRADILIGTPKAGGPTHRTITSADGWVPFDCAAGDKIAFGGLQYMSFNGVILKSCGLTD